MPISDFPAIVINASTGHTRDNKAWIIGRLLRDFEKSTGPLSSDKASQEWEALRVSVFKWDENREQGRPARDWLWYSGFAVIVLQISISIIPLTLLSEWATLVFVMGGIILASAQAALPQWGLEKWACPRHGATVSITRGNGYRHVMVLLGSPNALDMEVLASGSKGEEQHPITKAAVAVLAALWAVLLITIAGLKQGSWCKTIPLLPLRLFIFMRKCPGVRFRSSMTDVLNFRRSCSNWCDRDDSKHHCRWLPPVAERFRYAYQLHTYDQGLESVEGVIDHRTILPWCRGFPYSYLQSWRISCSER